MIEIMKLEQERQKEKFKYYFMNKYNFNNGKKEYTQE